MKTFKTHILVTAMILLSVQSFPGQAETYKESSGKASGPDRFNQDMIDHLKA